MSTRRRYLGWGVFLVCLGIVPLAFQLGWIDAAALSFIIRLWPLIVIAIGLGIVLRRTPYHAVGGVLAAGAFGLIVGAFLAGGFPGVSSCGGTSGGTPVEQTGSFAGPQADVSIDLTCGSIAVARTADPNWTVSVATTGDAPRIEPAQTSLALKSASGDFPPLGIGAVETWHVALPATASLNASVTLNAANGDLALGGGPLSEVSATFNGSDSELDLRSSTGGVQLSATLNASSVHLALPEQPVDASLTLNASTLRICVDPSVALRITYSEVLGSQNFAAAGLTMSDGNWVLPEASGPVATLHLTSNVSTATLDRSGECP